MVDNSLKVIGQDESFNPFKSIILKILNYISDSHEKWTWKTEDAEEFQKRRTWGLSNYDDLYATSEQYAEEKSNYWVEGKGHIGRYFRYYQLSYLYYLIAKQKLYNWFCGI